MALVLVKIPIINVAIGIDHNTFALPATALQHALIGVAVRLCQPAGTADFSVFPHALINHAVRHG